MGRDYADSAVERQAPARQSDTATPGLSDDLVNVAIAIHFPGAGACVPALEVSSVECDAAPVGSQLHCCRSGCLAVD